MAHRDGTRKLFASERFALLCCAALQISVSAAFCAWLAGCGGGEPGHLMPVARLGGEATATVADDMRPVLVGATWARWVPRRFTERADDAVWERLWLDADVFAAGQRLAVQPSIRVDGRWKPLDWRVLTVDPVDWGRPVPSVRVDLQPEELAGAEGRMHAKGFRLSADTRVEYRSDALEIPAGALLSTSVALVEASPSAGPILFRLSSCDEALCTVFWQSELDLDEGLAGWTEQRIAIPEELTGTRSLRFETQRRGGAEDYALPVWGAPQILAAAPPPGPNVILLSVDTLGADHLRSYGYDLDTAPFLSEELPRRGTLFERFVAGSTSTGPSHMTMFTSLTPTSHGLTEGRPRLREGVQTLAEVLRSAGYATVAITENGPLAGERGFARGFEIYKENTSADLLHPEGQIRDTLDEGARWLEDNSDRSFFLFLHSYEVHGPYAPPASYGSLFTESPQPETPLRVRYDQEIRYADDQIRAFVQRLEARGSLENTIVIITSDHGEEFLEHRFVGHGGGLYREVLQVPFLVFGEGIARGRRVRGTAAHVDIAPTILDLLGLSPLERGIGRSLRDAVSADGEGRIDPEARAIVYSAWIEKQLGLRGAQAPSFAIEHEGYKLIRYSTSQGPRFELYDLTNDPYEKEDVAARFPAAVSALDAMLDDELTAARAIADELSGDREAERPLAEPEISPEREEKLRALGYLE